MIPVSSFLSLERWSRQKAMTNREVWTNRQTTEGGGKEKPGERQANKETNKQRARQTKGPSATDRQTGKRELTEALVSQAGHMRRALSVCLCQSASLLECVSQDLWGFVFTGSMTIHFLGIFVLFRPLRALSLTLQQPRRWSHPSSPFHLRPSLHTPSEGDQTLPGGSRRLPQELGQSTRDGQEGQGLQLPG